MGNKIRVDLEVMGMKELSTLPKTPQPEPHHQMQFSIIPRIISIPRICGCVWVRACVREREKERERK